jgi:hypothetical protein
MEMTYQTQCGWIGLHFSKFEAVVNCWMQNRLATGLLKSNFPAGGPLVLSGISKARVHSPLYPHLPILCHCVLPYMAAMPFTAMTKLAKCSHHHKTFIGFTRGLEFSPNTIINQEFFFSIFPLSTVYCIHRWLAHLKTITYRQIRKSCSAH